MANRLSGESSPYLLQHVENPVEWHPWGDEALAAARQSDRPIFLSIGYSACHWCHVMAHESFENAEIAAFLNEHFIPIKVDREERPEIDQLYMEAVQMMTGHGGWPLSVFLTPDLEPFFGGTYWPPHGRSGMPGFMTILRGVAEVWRERRTEVFEQGRQISRYLQHELSHAEGHVARGSLSDEPLRDAESTLLRNLDRTHGGFGRAPKFPPAINLRNLLRRWRHSGNRQVLSAVELTLDKMAAGGMYDHLGGGFHRYSVDAHWLVPHFEKMLYDNALLAQTYLEAWQATGKADYVRVVRETLDYLLRDMRDPAGGFHSAEDADSEGHEGLFYLWTAEEVSQALAPEIVGCFMRFYDVTAAGNFEGRNILNRPQSIEQAAKSERLEPAELERRLAVARQRLFDVRAERVRPGLDDKVLVAWNALAIDALAQAGAVLGEPRYLRAAVEAADFLLGLRDAEGRLLHVYHRGKAKVRAFLDDYAGLAVALVSLYEATFEPRWLDEASRLVETIETLFGDEGDGSYYFAPVDGQRLPARKKDVFDSSTPSGNGLAALALLKLSRLLARDDFAERAMNLLIACWPWIERGSTGCGQLLLALEMELSAAAELVFVPGNDPAANVRVLADLRRRFLPNKVVAMRPEGELPPLMTATFEGKPAVSPGPTLYVCQNRTCQPAVSGEAAIGAALDRMNSPPGP